MASRPWTRLDLGARLLAGYRADDSGVVLNGGVSRLPDYGPAGIHMTQANASKRPPLVANALNGRPIIVPNNGVPHGLEAATPLGLMNRRPGYTVVALIKRVDGAIWGESDANGASYSGVRYYNPNINVYLRGDDNGPSSGYSYNANSFADWHVIAFRDTVTRSEVSLDGGPWLGTNYSRPNTTFDKQPDFRLFSVWIYDYAGLDFAEILFLNSVADDDIARTVGAVAWDWGPPGSNVDLVGKLASTHPYKSAAPTVETASSGTVQTGSRAAPGVGGMAAAGRIIRAGKALAAGVGGMAAAGRLVRSGGFTAAAVGGLQPGGRLIRSGGFTAAAVGGLWASGGPVRPGGFTAAATGSLSAAGGVFRQSTRAATALGGLTARGGRTTTGAFQASAVGRLSARNSPNSYVPEGTYGAGDFGAGPFGIYVADGKFVASGLSGAARGGQRLRQSAASASATGGLSAKSGVIRNNARSAATAGGAAVSPVRDRLGATRMSGLSGTIFNPDLILKAPTVDAVRRGSANGSFAVKGSRLRGVKRVSSNRAAAFGAGRVIRQGVRKSSASGAARFSPVFWAVSARSAATRGGALFRGGLLWEHPGSLVGGWTEVPGDPGVWRDVRVLGLTIDG